MRLPEQRLWDNLKKHSVLPGDVSRIENIVDSGTPDLSCAWNGIDYWVELKVFPGEYFNNDFETLLRPAQNVWHIRRLRQGSIIFVFVKTKTDLLVYLRSPKQGCTIKWSFVPSKKRLDWSCVKSHIETILLDEKKALKTT